MRKFLLVMVGVLYSKTVFLRQLSRQMRHCLKGNTLLLVILLQLLFMLKGFLFFVSEDVIRCRDAKRCRVPSSVVPHCNPFKDNFCVWHQNFSSILRVILRLYTMYSICNYLASFYTVEGEEVGGEVELLDIFKV